MRIWHLASEFPPATVTGLGRMVDGLARAQATAGDDVIVFSSHFDQAPPDQLRPDGVRVIRIADPIPHAEPAVDLGVTLFALGAVTEILRRRDSLPAPDIINLHDWYPVPAGWVLQRHFRCAQVLTLHDTALGKARENSNGELTNSARFIAKVEHSGGRQAGHVICGSRHMVEELTGAYGFSPQDVTAIPCGIDTHHLPEVPATRVAEVRGRYAEGDGAVVLFVGRFVPEKGIDLIIAAADTVLARARDSRFVIAGAGPLEEALRQDVTRRGLQHAFHFPGFLQDEELSAHYRMADLLVMPSRYEPFGQVCLEGMCHALPVVVPDATALSEFVDHGTHGLQFTSGDSGALANAIVRLACNPELRRQLGDNGRRLATTRFRWSEVAARTKSAYMQAMDSR